MNQKFRYIIVRWLALIICLALAMLFVLFKLRNIIFVSAKSKAENIVLNASNKAIINVLKNSDIKYEDISVVSRDSDGNITGIEIDTNKINLLKSMLSEEMYKIIEQNGVYSLKIPLGTLLNQEYTSGYGPKLTFKMEIAHYEKFSFKSKFCDAGINNVLHQVMIDIDINCSVLAAGYSRSFNISTEALAAQTVISGKVPESFTNVDESNGEDIADDIFNFRN